MKQAESDQQLIYQVLNGNRAAFGFLVDKYQHSVYALIRRIIHDEAEAQDVAQMVFIKAFEKLSSFNHKSLFSTWLHSVAYHTAISAYRKRKPVVVELDSVISRGIAADDAMRDEQDEKEEQLHLLEQMLKLLPAEENLLVYLFYTSGQSMNEISSITGLSLANIKVKLFRIRKKLLLMMENAAVKQLN